MLLSLVDAKTVSARCHRMLRFIFAVCSFFGNTSFLLHDFQTIPHIPLLVLSRSQPMGRCNIHLYHFFFTISTHLSLLITI